MNNRYLHFTVEDFIADEAFQQWVQESRGETADLWQKWLLENPGKTAEVHEASIFINHLSIPTNFPSKQRIDSSFAKTLLQIEALEKTVTVRKSQQNRRNKHLVFTAFVVLTVSLLYVFVFQTAQRVTLQEIAAGNKIRTILLPDSTEIILNKNASIKFLSNLANIKTREVWLDGEAYFDVRHLQEKGIATKFIVHVNEMNIEVLGTTFNIKKRNDVYNVSLNTGKINITLKNDVSTLVTLSPGDFLQYSTVDKNIVRKKVHSELYSDWKREKMVLDNTPLSEIAAFIHDIYGYNIVMKNKAIEKEKISGTIMLTDEQTMLQALSYALNLKISKENNDLIFEFKTKK